MSRVVEAVAPARLGLAPIPWIPAIGWTAGVTAADGVPTIVTDRRALSFVNLYMYGGGFDMAAGQDVYPKDLDFKRAYTLEFVTPKTK